MLEARRVAASFSAATAPRSFSWTRRDDGNATIARWVADHGQPENVRDASKDPRFLSSDATNVLCHPVEDGTVIAVLQFFNKPGGFTERDDHVADMLASHCALVLLDE